MAKICKDCEEEIEHGRLKLYPQADKCSMCAAPLTTERNILAQKHIPRSDVEEFSKVASPRHKKKPSEEIDENTLKEKLTKIDSNVRSKLNFKKAPEYECPFCYSALKLREIFKENYELKCLTCGWKGLWPPR